MKAEVEAEAGLVGGTRSKRTSAVTRTSTDVPSPHSNRLNLLIQGWAAQNNGDTV